ncbi:MAG: PP2C family serine/threonine-protein phosphatase [Pseudomonadota bacterium]
MTSFQDELIKVIRWKLDIPVELASQHTQEIWALLSKEVWYKRVALNIASSLEDQLKQEIGIKLGLSHSHTECNEYNSSLCSLWKCFVSWIEISKPIRLPTVQRKILGIINKNGLVINNESDSWVNQLILGRLRLVTPILRIGVLNERARTLQSDPKYSRTASEIANFLATNLFGQVVRYKLNLLTDHVATKEDVEILDSKWKCFIQWLSDDYNERSFFVSREIEKELKKISSDQVQSFLKKMSVIDNNGFSKLERQVHGATKNLVHQHEIYTIGRSDKHSIHQDGNQPHSLLEIVNPQKNDGLSFDKNQTSNIGLPKPETPPSIVPQWKCQSISDGPDKHTEFESRCLDLHNEFKLIGARVRGKKHKHDGTNCDDWFNFAVSGNWTIIAVSDGAGSKKFSRVGSQAACNAAVDKLVSSLKDHKVNYRDTWNAETFRRDDTGVNFAEEDLEIVQKALHQSMHSAYEAMEKAAADRSNSVDHFEILGRRLEISDLSATLLIAVHTKVKLQNGETSLIFTCSVGDGMIAVIDKNGATRLLMTPDSGEFSGEVTFLNKKELQPEKLFARTFPFMGTVQALLTMTDGVSDDYFPNDPGMSLLYGDLILNQIIQSQGSDEADVEKALSKTKLPTLADIKKAEFHKLLPKITDNDPKEVTICSMATFTEELGLPVQEVLASQALLTAGSWGGTMFNDILPEENLRMWLDSYQVRGSFDDRTLVIMYREVL